MSITLAALNVYPIKGCAGIALTEATLSETGLSWAGVNDRHWVLTNAQGRFLSQRQLPRMACIQTRIADGLLHVDAPGMDTLSLAIAEACASDARASVSIWQDQLLAATQSPQADAWFSRFLGQPTRLLRFAPEAQRLSDPRYTQGARAPYQFADAFALLITNQASLAELNQRLSAPVAMNRFRANLVLEGLDAFDEDHASELHIGSASLRITKACTRCTVPGVDPQTGEFSADVPDALASFRRREQGVLFGVNAMVSAGAGSRLAVGDPVDIAYNF